MTDQEMIDAICASRDTALSALGSAVMSIGNQIAQTTQPGAYLDQLTKRYQDLMSERAAIRAAATAEVLALPSVMAAADNLSSLSTQMQDTASALPAATNLLTSTTTILSLGQQFADAIAGAQKV